MPEISNGHIAFVPRASGGFFEYFTRDLQIYRADSANPVMPDCYRVGRWYSSIRPQIIESILEASRKVA